MCEENGMIVTPYNIVNNTPISQSMVADTQNQIRIFLIAQARSELEKVISITETLDKMQTMYQEKALQYMADHNDETALKYLPPMIETLTNCLENSYNIINRVVANEKIMTFQLIQNNVSDSTISIGSSSSSYTGTLDDPVSRERVRNVLAEILRDVKDLGDQ